MLKAVLFIELLIQLRWLNKQKKKHHASDGYCIGSWSQPCPTPAAGAHTGSEPGHEHVSGEGTSSLTGRRPKFTRHSLQHMYKRECTVAPCFE